MSITRTRTLIRARFGWEQGTVEFSRSTRHPGDGYLQTMSGFVSMCWKIPQGPGSVGGLDTVALEGLGYVWEIQPQELKPGDAMGLCGPNSADGQGGTLVLFSHWRNDDMYNNGNVAIVWELPIDGYLGPIQRARPYDPKWHYYRYRDIED